MCWPAPTGQLVTGDASRLKEQLAPVNGKRISGLAGIAEPERAAVKDLEWKELEVYATEDRKSEASREAAVEERVEAETSSESSPDEQERRGKLEFYL